MFAGELRKQRALFALADAVGLGAAFVVALGLHDPSGAIERRLREAQQGWVALGALAIVLLWLLVFRTCGLYRMRRGGLRESTLIAKACSWAMLLSLLGLFLVHLQLSRITLTLAYLLSIPLVAAARALTRRGVRRLYADPRVATPLVVIGFNSLACRLLDQLLDEATPYEPVCFLDPGWAGRQYRGYPVFGEEEQLSELVSLYPSIEAVLVMPDRPLEEQERLIRHCERWRLRWSVVPSLPRIPAGGVTVDLIGGVPLVGLRGSNIEGLNFAVKRLLDLVVGTALLAASLPVLVLAAVAIRLSDSGPVLFRQPRAGIHGRLFNLLKLRTMKTAAADTLHRDYATRWIRDGARAAEPGRQGGGASLYKLAEDPRVTSVGRVLRRFSIDELPQLVNVLRGEMSLVGPRPALPYELELYQDWHRRRLEVSPGITGLWQVSGRNGLCFDDMVRLDLEYLENWSLELDLRILGRTAAVMVGGTGH